MWPQHLGEELQVEREAALGEGAQAEAERLRDRIRCEVLPKQQRLHREAHPAPPACTLPSQDSLPWHVCYLTSALLQQLKSLQTLLNHSS